MKLSHFTMSWRMASSPSRWACSVFFSWDVKAVSCSFHWSVSAVTVFRYSVSFKKQQHQQKTTFSHDRGTKTCWEHWKGHAWLPLTTGKCCNAQLFLTNSAHWDAVGWRAAASSCQSTGKKDIWCFQLQNNSFLKWYNMYIYYYIIIKVEKIDCK